MSPIQMITRSYQPAGPGATLGDSARDSRVAYLNRARHTPPGRNSIDLNTTTTTLSSSRYAPTMDTQSVAGMVDLHTLAKMYEVLNSSQDDDDRKLAAWTKEHYLLDEFGGVIEEGGVAIRDAEGFAKLYNAYKRVRTLTNRAQDKWPFFDRRWKTMSSSQVTQMATSNDIPPSPNATAKLPVESPAVHHTEEDGPTTLAIQAPIRTSFTPFDQTSKGQPPATGITEAEATRESGQLNTRVERLPTPSPPNMAPTETPSRPTENDQVTSDIFATSTPTSVLAAEFEPEHSNLDDRPKSSGGKRKRDSKDFDERGLFARGHGNLQRSKRGRKGGRGNKSLVTEQADSTDRVTDHTPSTFKDRVSRKGRNTGITDAPVKKPKAAPPSPRVTRRQTRLSGGNDNQDAASRPSPTQAEPQEVGSPKSHADSDATTDDTEHNNTVSQVDKDTTSTDNDSATSDPTGTDILALALSHYERPKTQATPKAEADQDMEKLGSKAVSLDKAVKQDTKSQELGTVTYFARIKTGTASFEVMLDDAMTDNKKLNSDLLGYAAWKESMGVKSTDVSFDMWLSIFSFGR